MAFKARPHRILAGMTNAQLRRKLVEAHRAITGTLNCPWCRVDYRIPVRVEEYGVVSDVRDPLCPNCGGPYRT